MQIAGTGKIWKMAHSRKYLFGSQALRNCLLDLKSGVAETALS
jgi:hypothetical protein